MKHYGAEPPWKGESEFGRWRWVPPDPHSWFDDEQQGHWQWYPQRPVFAKILDQYYMPAITEMLNRESFLVKAFA